MKKLILVINVFLVFLVGCTTHQPLSTVYNDDVYANPREDKLEEARINEIRKKEQSALDKRYNDSIARVNQLQKEKDDANPYYKDREFKYDDYYDYEYATRVKRFNNQINGLSYYDNYYTNSYWYNQNPYNYGVSVYNGYSWWGSSYKSYCYSPSVNFYSNLGWGNTIGYGYNGYNPYMSAYTQGYNNGFNNGYFGNYYGYGSPYYGGNYFGYNNFGNPYGYGGYNHYNLYNNGWGYYNSYDHNSSYTYGPRASHGGGNSNRVSNPGINGQRESYYQKYVDEVSDKQIREVKFAQLPNVVDDGLTTPTRVGGHSIVPAGTGGIKPVRNTEPTRSNHPIKNVDEVQPDRNPNINVPIKAPIKNEAPVRQNPIRNTVPIKEQQPNQIRNEVEAPQIRQNNNDFSTPRAPSNSGGGNMPSGNGGGSHRPR
jgi:hypothetical protein